MKDKLMAYIADFHQSELPEPYRRELSLPVYSETVNKVLVLIGIRRGGKTWCTYQMMHDLLKSGVAKEQIIHINFEDDRLASFSVDDFQSILDAYYQLYPEMDGSGMIYFFFDEIHEVDGWEKFVRRLSENNKNRIVVTGSSAKLLSKEIATSLRGRSLSREIFPLSFCEYLGYHNIEFENVYGSKATSKIQHYLDLYLKWGGFPETLGASSETHRELIQNYMDVVIYKDIVERHNVTNIVALKQMQIMCLKNAGTKFSMSKIFRNLKSRGLSIGKNAIYEFMDYFHDAYALFPVSAYEFSVNKLQQSPKKIYPIDSGVITAYTLKPEFELASRLETAVFLHLRRSTENIFYYQSKNGKEIDFLTHDINGQFELYQVTVDMLDPETRKREIQGLASAMLELDQERGTIVTHDHEEIINVDEGLIQCIPIWKFLITHAD